MQKLHALLCFFLLCACTPISDKADEMWRHAVDGAFAADISADGNLAVVSTIGGGIRVWSLDSLKPKYEWRQSGDGANTVGMLNLAPDKSFVVSADRDSFALWNLQSGEPEGIWRIDESSIRDVAVSDMGRGILVGRGNGKVMFFEPKTGRRLEFLGHQEKINSVALSPNGFYALTGGNDYVAYLWDTRSGQVIYRFTHTSRVTKVELDDQGRYAFTADSKRGAFIWDLHSGNKISQLHFIERQKIFSSARFSADGHYLLTGSPGRNLILWDVTTGDKLQSWLVHPREQSTPPTAVVYAVGFRKDGKILSESSSGLAELWSPDL